MAKIDAGVRQPPYTVIQLGAAYLEIRRFFQRVKPGFNLRGWRSEPPRHRTSHRFPPQQAAFAKRREFTEPFLMEDDAGMIELQRVAEAGGFKITRGGRFYHLMGSGQDKGIALGRAISLFPPKRRVSGCSPSASVTAQTTWACWRASTSPSSFPTRTDLMKNWMCRM